MWRTGRRAYLELSSLLRLLRLSRLGVGRWRLDQLLDALVRQFVWNVLLLRRPQTRAVRGLTLHLGNSAGLPLSFLTGTYEQETTKVFESLLSPGITVVDVGAHIGWYTLLAARAVGGRGRVYAFEPEPSNLSLLAKNVQANGFAAIVSIVAVAVSSKPGDGSLYVGRQGTVSASLYRTPGTGSKSVRVEVTSLDHFFAGLGWPAVQLLKMDIEGAEKEALLGMGELSAKNRDLKLIMEASPVTQEAAGARPEDLLALLQALGFSQVSIIGRDLEAFSLPLDGPAFLTRLEKAQRAGSGFNVLCEK